MMGVFIKLAPVLLKLAPTLMFSFCAVIFGEPELPAKFKRLD